MNNETIQVFDNPQARCPVSLLLDVSDSMSGQPISELNEGVKVFFEEIKKDDFARFSVELEIITYGGQAVRKMDFTSFSNGEITSPELFSSGMTPMGAAMEMALNDLERRKQSYKSSGIPYYQPWMVLMTDGQPNDAWQNAANRARELSDQRKLVFIGIGIGEQADMSTLTQICPVNRPPKQLQGLNFAEFFEWLSASMSQVSRSSVGDKITLPPTDGWAAI
jgi:uncharacterized protein YegL